MSLSWVQTVAIVVLNALALWILKRWATGYFHEESHDLVRKQDLERILTEVRNLAALQKTTAEARTVPPQPATVEGPGEFTRLFQSPVPAPSPAPGRVPSESTGIFGATPKPPGWVEIKVFYATDREPTGSVKPVEFFSGHRSPASELSYGSCEVSIPRDHRLGALEAPSFLKLQFSPDPEKHVVLLEIVPQSKEDFFASVSHQTGQSVEREVFIFVHGYNVSFEDAARRTGQIAYDLGFCGSPILYSWPSEARPQSYPIDEANAEWSTLHFKMFLKDVAELSGSKNIHIIGHSMGNRLLASALHQLNSENFAPPARFHQVVLAAPDIDAATLRQLANAMRSTAERITLYASAADKALVLSRRFHRYPRAGEFIFPMEGIDLIDASAIDTSLIGHSYYGDNRSVLSDIFWLLRKGEPPSHRFGMSVLSGEDGTYYAFLP